MTKGQQIQADLDLPEMEDTFPEGTKVEILGENDLRGKKGAKLITLPNGNQFRIAPEKSDGDFIMRKEDFGENINFKDIKQLEIFFENFVGVHFQKGLLKKYLTYIGIVKAPFALTFENLQALYTLSFDHDEVFRRLNGTGSELAEA
ncbi:MAG: hypothetical protein ACMG57_00335 [Candidatus Dojkabacteria bacterium]